MLFQFRDSLQISLSVDRRGSIVGLLAAAGIGGDLNSFDPNRLLLIVMYRNIHRRHDRFLTGQLHSNNVVD